MEIKVYNAGNQPMPAYQSDGAAAFDLYADSVSFDTVNELISYGTGLHFEIPRGYYGMVVPRSSICKKRLILANHYGVIDSDYRGEVCAIFRHLDKVDLEENFIPGVYHIGERIAQMMILPVRQVGFVQIESNMLLSKTLRGDGGFGSTGK